MLKQQKGFTLIELLIVIVIIGILAAIAIPKFGKTREKAYFQAMTSDLRNLVSQQELYFGNPNNTFYYAGPGDPTTLNLDFQPSQGVTVDVTAAGQTGWSATASHAALTATQICGYFTGDAAIQAPAVTSGVIACIGQ
ncbi:MAG: prepilin-type N-terminal cleavage/methylation domain-containing protein [Gemmatimonadota bacterium]